MSLFGPVDVALDVGCTRVYFECKGPAVGRLDGEEVFSFEGPAVELIYLS